MIVDLCDSGPESKIVLVSSNSSSTQCLKEITHPSHNIQVLAQSPTKLHIHTPLHLAKNSSCLSMTVREAGMVQVAGLQIRPGLRILMEFSWEVVSLMWEWCLLTVVLALPWVTTVGQWWIEVDQHQVMGTGSGYYLRGGQPRQLQLQGQCQGRLQGRRCGQLGHSEVVGAGDEVDGHGVGISSGSDTDDLDTTLEGDDPVDVVQRPHSLIGDQCITPERRQYSLVGSLQTTEEQRRPAAAAGYDDNESITGFKPHSLCLSSDVNCFDSVDYSHI